MYLIYIADLLFLAYRLELIPFCYSIPKNKRRKSTSSIKNRFWQIEVYLLYSNSGGYWNILRTLFFVLGPKAFLYVVSWLDLLPLNLEYRKRFAYQYDRCRKDFPKRMESVGQVRGKTEIKRDLQENCENDGRDMVLWMSDELGYIILQIIIHDFGFLVGSYTFKVLPDKPLISPFSAVTTVGVSISPAPLQSYLSITLGFPSLVSCKVKLYGKVEQIPGDTLTANRRVYEQKTCTVMRL